MKFVIIGGDAAGMSAASRAKRQQPDMQVTVLEQSQHVSYSACGMPYNIADPQRSMDDLVVRGVEVFQDKQGIDVRLGHRAEKIDRATSLVSGTNANGDDFSINYDRLLIATGASPVVPDLPGFRNPGVLALKSLDDGHRIKEYIRTKPVAKTTIIGMGYIALEMCEALVNRGIRVDMVKPRPRLLPWLDGQLAERVQAQLLAKGVNLFAGHAVERIENSGKHLITACRDLALVSDMVLVAAGIRPNSQIAAAADLDLGPHQAIAVGRDLRTTDTNIFAAGDCADAFHVVTGQRVWIPLALRANRAGWAAADNICGKAVQLPGVAGTAVFKVFDLQVAKTGLSADEAAAAGFTPQSATIVTRSRAHAHPGSASIQVHMLADQESGRLLGAQMVGKEGVAHRINAAAVALSAQMDVDQFLQCDLAYAPPFGPVWDPLLTCANQLLKKLSALR